MAGHAQQVPRGNDPHGAHGIMEQGRVEGDAFRWRQQGADGAHCTFPHLRGRVSEILGRQFQRLFTRIVGQFDQQRRALDRRQIAASQLLIQRLGRTGLAAANQHHALGVSGRFQHIACPGGDAEAVVMAQVITHVDLARHVAVDAERTRLADRFTGVFRRIIIFGL